MIFNYIYANSHNIYVIRLLNRKICQRYNLFGEYMGKNTTNVKKSGKG